MVTIREHKIPSADSKPYIAVEGPDGKLWFCQSGASKIGRFDPDCGTFDEFALPTRNATPIGITLGADGNLWFAEKSANQIGRITPMKAGCRRRRKTWRCMSTWMRRKPPYSPRPSPRGLPA